MSQAKTKTCWPWSHIWTKWEMSDGTAFNKISGNTREALVQVRECKKCGFHQIEGVSGR